MIDDAFSKAFSAAEPFASVETFAASSQEVNNGARRLEGTFYGSAGYRAIQAMRRSGFRMTDLGDFATVAWPGMFRRTYVDDVSTGLPFFTTSGMMMAKPDPQKLVSRVLTPGLDDLVVQGGTILISRSGTIGRTIIATADLANAVVTEDAIRVICHQTENCGVIYAFLLSEAGQFLLRRNKSGSVVEHIYEADVSSLPLPLLPKALRCEMTRLVEESSALRVKANRLLDEAQQAVQLACYLPDLSEFTPKGLHRDDGGFSTFIYRSQDRFTPQNGYGEIRLDATYHEPVAVALAKHILSSKRGYRLGQLVKEVRNSTLRRRVYVDDPALGVPLVGGKQLIQWHPTDVNYLSKMLTRNLPNETVGSGWTLVSCGGTLGRVMYVHRNFEGWAASQDVMRVIPDINKAAPGFVYAFLVSPYGQVQLHQRGYGSVIPRLRDFQFKSIAVRLPQDAGQSIHDKVVQAFDTRADARQAEEQAETLFKMALDRGHDYIESEWGSEY